MTIKQDMRLCYLFHSGTVLLHRHSSSCNYHTTATLLTPLESQAQRAGRKVKASDSSTGCLRLSVVTSEQVSHSALRQKTRVFPSVSFPGPSPTRPKLSRALRATEAGSVRGTRLGSRRRLGLDSKGSLMH